MIVMKLVYLEKLSVWLNNIYFQQWLDYITKVSLQLTSIPGFTSMSASLLIKQPDCFLTWFS